MKRMLLVYLTTLALLLSMMPLFAPGAQAQASEASVNADPATTNVEVVPFGTPREVQIPTVLDIRTAGIQPTTTVQVTASVSGVPSWLSVSVSPKTHLFPVDPMQAGGGQTPQRTFNLIFSATGQAPAQTPTSVTLDFTPTAGTGDLDVKGQSFDFEVTATYYSIVSFRLASPFLRVGPTETATFPLTISNTGNGETMMNFEIAEKGQERWQVPTPPQFSVPATQTGAESNERTVNIQVTSELSTGWYNDIGVVTTKISPFYAPQPDKKGVETFVSFLAHFQGIYVPGFSTAGVLGALAAVGLLARGKKLGGL